MSTHPKLSEPLPRELAPLARAEVADTDSISLRALIDIARSGRWVIASFVAASAAIGAGYALLATPIYETQALVQIERPRGALPGLERVMDTRDEAGPAQTEIEIMRSRLILGQVVDELNLQLKVEPARAPVIGSYLARRYGHDEPAPPRFGAVAYAWGGEQLKIERFETNDRSDDKTFILIADQPGTYALYDEGGQELVRGRVGEVAVAPSRSSDQPMLAITVSRLEARPGTRFEISQQSWLRAVDSLRSKLSIRERGMGTGILELRLEGEDPGHLERVLNEVAKAYVRQHVEQRSAEARRSLEFLEEQLPELRAQVEASEQALNDFRRANHAVDLGADAQNLLGQIVAVETELLDLDMRRLEQGRRFTKEHPVMRTIAEKERRLRETKARLESRVGTLPSREQQALRLQREVDVATELYTSLLNTAQELRVAQAGTIGNARILDAAVKPEAPFRPRRAQIGAMSLALGFLLGLAMVYARHALRRTVRDADTLEQATGLPIYGLIPHSPAQQRATRLARRRGRQASLLAAEQPGDPAIEGLRSFRTSLHLALLREGEKVIAVTSPAEGSGTSFACINAGYLLAETGLRVLVIDADLRSGSVHQHVGTARSPGLSEVLSGHVGLGEAVRAFGETSGEPTFEVTPGQRPSGLYTLATGSLPTNPSELLMAGGLEELLEQARAIFDLVLLDTPPVLAFTDATIVGAQAGATFMLVRAGRSEARSIEAAIKRLSLNNVFVTAILLNDLPASAVR